MAIGKIKSLVHSAPMDVVANQSNALGPAARGGVDELLLISKPLSLGTIPGCHAWLTSKGWSSSAVVCIRGGKKLYVVASNRGDEAIVGQDENQLTAWKDVVKHAVH